jgi:hypothetical protein
LEAGSDILDALDEIRPLQPKNNTFPGEVFLRLAAQALAEDGVSQERPIAEQVSLAWRSGSRHYGSVVF